MVEFEVRRYGPDGEPTTDWKRLGEGSVPSDSQRKGMPSGIGKVLRAPNTKISSIEVHYDGGTSAEFRIVERSAEVSIPEGG